MEDIKDFKARILEALEIVSSVETELDNDYIKPISEFHENSIFNAAVWASKDYKEVEALITRLVLTFDNVGELAFLVADRRSEYVDHQAYLEEAAD